MPASDNPYKSLRATIPDIPLNTSDTYDGTPNLYPSRICVGAEWEMCLGPYKTTGHQPVRAVTNSMAGMEEMVQPTPVIIMTLTGFYRHGYGMP